MSARRMWLAPRRAFRVLRHGDDIREYGVKGAVNTGVSYSTAYEEWDAAVNANLDLWLWENSIYPYWFRVRVVAFHRLRMLIRSHEQDAQNRAIEKASKRR